jgi:hypothetical protein
MKDNEMESKTFVMLVEEARAKGPDKALETQIQCEGKGCRFGSPAGDVFRGKSRDREFKFWLLEVYDGESEGDAVPENLILQAVRCGKCTGDMEKRLEKEKQDLHDKGEKGLLWKITPLYEAVRDVCFRQEKIPLWEKLAKGGKLALVTIGQDPEKDEDVKCGLPGLFHNHRGMRDKVDKETGDIIREGKRSYYVPEEAQSVDDIVRVCSVDHAAYAEVKKRALDEAKAKGDKNYRFPVVLYNTLDDAEDELMRRLRAGDGVTLIHARMEMRRKGREVPSDAANSLGSQVKAAMGSVKPAQPPVPPASPEPEPAKAEKPKGKKGKDKDAEKQLKREEKMEEETKASQKTASPEPSTESAAEPPPAEADPEVTCDREADGKKQLDKFQKRADRGLAKKLGMATG